ncbi:MAG: glycosyltransferase [Gaiellaceae bacterium]
MMAPTTTVVMLTRDRFAYTRRALTTLAATRGNVEWVVVDNGSSDGTPEFLDAWARSAPDRLVVRHEVDPGGSAARNRGFERASGDYVVFLDNDVYLEEPGWLEALLAVPQADGAVVAAAPVLLFPGESALVQSAGGGVTARGRFGLLGRGSADRPDAGATPARAWAPTACLLVRREAFLSASGFDEAFDPVSICEDVDLCCRLRALGGEVAVVGASRLRHYEGTTFGHAGQAKFDYWRRHARTIRRRWHAVMMRGPLHTEDEIAWRPIVKDYADLRRASVRVASDREAASQDLSFFASRAALPTSPSYVRVGVLGCGQVALRGALPGLSPPGSPLAAAAAPFLAFDGARGVRVVGVSDPELDRARAAAARFGALHAEADTERLLDTVPMEGAVVCAPPDRHSELARAALARDISVLVEKPAACTREELDALVAARAAHPERGCMVNLPWAFHPAVATLAAAISAGRLGTPLAAAAVFEHGGPETWAPNAAWQRDPKVGGIVRDLGPHVLLVLERLLGVTTEPLFDSSFISEERARVTGMAGAVEVSIELGWDAPRPRFSVGVRGSDAAAHVELIPWRGSIGAASIRLGGSAGSLDVPPDPIGGGPYRQFVSCVAGPADSPTDLDRVAPVLGCVLDWAQQRSREPA